MILLQVVFTIITPILIIVGIGYILGRCCISDVRPFARGAFFVFIPALVVDGIANSDLQAGEMGRILLLVLLLTLTMTIIAWSLATMSGFEPRLQSAFLLSTVLMNAGNYGLALSEFAFGAAGLRRAIIFFVGSSIINNNFGVFLASRSTASFSRSLRNVLTVPHPYAVLLGLAVKREILTLPVPFTRALSMLGRAAVPVMLLTLGIQLSHTFLKGRMGPLLLSSGLRLGLAPIVAFLLVTLLGLRGLAAQVSIVQASVPPAVLTTILAAEYGSDAEFTSAAVLIATLLSVITISIVLILVM